MFCSRCGLRVEEGNRFCQGCGQEVGGAVLAAQAPTGLAPGAVPSGSGFPAALPFAGFWERVGAYLIDGLILGIPFGALAIVLVLTFGGFSVLLHRRSADPDAAAAVAGPAVMLFFLAMMGFLVVQWLYFAGMESSERQATFGKSVMSLRVANYDGQRISFGHATGRFFAKIVSGMVPFAIGYIMAAFTEKKQALHDFIAGTVVLRG
jgi:uncharacterized RDD family membrane protein YckC